MSADSCFVQKTDEMAGKRADRIDLRQAYRQIKQQSLNISQLVGKIELPLHAQKRNSISLQYEY
jgi:hypothetical protein